MNARTPLEVLLRRQIAEKGPLSFHDVMDAALYHPEHGYYTNLRGFGAEGDFITSPEHHPAFGWLLGRQALDVWETLGRPQPFNILELGGGSGALAEPLVRFLGSYVSGLVYTIDEPSESLKSVQQRRLVGPVFRWDSTQGPAHFIIANEVADALPVHRVVRRNDRYQELQVEVDTHGSLSWREAEGAPLQVEAYFAELHYVPPEGQVVDIALGLPDWVKQFTCRLDERGVALVLDYAASPPRDSLLTYYRHTMGSDPLVRLGQQDISANVDFRTLVRVAIAQGLRAGATAQRGLLLNLGFVQVASHLTGTTDRRALARLVHPDGLGGQITAAFLIRGMADYKPVGAVGRADWPEPEGVPSLPPDEQERAILNQWREAFPTEKTDTAADDRSLR